MDIHNEYRRLAWEVFNKAYGDCDEGEIHALIYYMGARKGE